MHAKHDHLLVGAHTSAAGGAYHAIKHGESIGATCIQLFTSNQQTWRAHKTTKEEIDLWEKTIEQSPISHVMSHGSYLVNLGSPVKETLHKSKKAFLDEIIRCHQLKIPYLNIHPGAATGSSEEDCLNTIVESLLSCEKLINEGETRIIFETTAGQGSAVGYIFEHMAYIIDRIHKKIPVGVCIDTCHTFAAGYDIRNGDAWDKTLKEFDKVIGLKHLFAFHANDSKGDLGSRIDRHESLGQGCIGLKCFEFLMTDKRVCHLPKYLETPDPELYPKEIQMLFKFGEKNNEK